MPNYKTNLNTKDAIEQYTNVRFKKAGVNYMAKCPFHDDRNESMSYNTKKNKVHCFACDFDYDAVDFLTRYLNKEVDEVKDILGIPISEQYQITKSEKGKIINFAEDCIKKYKNYKGWSIKDIYRFTNIDGSTHHFVVKFIDNDGKKQPRPFRIEADTNKVLCNLEGVEPKHVPYNLYRLANNNNSDNPKPIFILEGEKDADTISKYGFLATSMKGYRGDVEAIEELFQDKDIYIIGDTGEAGKKYIEEWKEHYFNIANSIHVIKLPGLEAMGDNKDVTDWIEAGHTKEELYRAFNKSLNLKSHYDLQQNSLGIYKQVPSKMNEGDYDKIYITNFQILKAISTVNIDENIEGVELTIKADNGNKLIVKALATDFDDIRAFRNRLGSMDLAFRGKINDLISLKEWIAKYFINSRFKLINGNKFLYEEDKLKFITPNGAITPEGIDKTIKSNEDNLKISLPESEINKDELKELIEYLFKFTTPARAYSIIGTVVNNLAVAQSEKLKIKLHHLLIVGEAGSGKSTILEKVIAPLLNYSIEEIKAIGEATKFSLIKTLSSGNYTVLYDEFKPSMMSKYKKDELSNILRNLYDRTSISRGQKNMTVKDYRLSRPLIMAGEESFAYGETAQLERSCIVYLSKNERTTENTKAMEYLIEHEEALNKLGKVLINEVLKLSIEDYKAIRNNIEVTEINNRIKNTCVNICAGMEIFNRILDRYGLAKVENFIEPILENIKAEILEDKEEVSSVVEQLLKKFDELLEDNKVTNPDRVIQDKRDETEIYIKTNLMLDEIRMYVKNTNNNNIIVISDRDFTKQAKKAGYILGAGREGKYLHIKEEDNKYKTVRFDIYSKEKLRTLEVNSIVEPLLIPVTKEEEKVIQGVFDKKK